jgi:hypothetical protein
VQRLARCLGHALARGRIGNKGRRRGRRRWDQRRGRVAAEQRHHGNACQALIFQPDLRIRTHRRRRHDRDGGGHVAGTGGIEGEVSHLADPDAVEQDGGAGQEAGHGVLEANAVKSPLTEPAGIVEPIDEAEDGADGGKHEQSNQCVGGACFHGSATGFGADAARERLPRK